MRILRPGIPGIDLAAVRDFTKSLPVLRFMIVGLLNTGVTIGTIYFALYVIGLGDLTANAIGYITGFAIGFVINRRWTFRSYSTARKEFTLYVVSFVVSYTVNIISVIALEQIGISPLYAQAMGLPVYTGCFFILCRLVVFAHV